MSREYAINERFVEAESVSEILTQYFGLGQTYIGAKISDMIGDVLQEAGRFDAYQEDHPSNDSPITIRFTAEIVAPGEDVG